jgi:hypothetical protein
MTSISIADMTATLIKLSISIPNFAPDFSKREVAEAWCEHLCDLSFSAEQWKKVFKVAAQTCEKFPSIAELVKIANGSDTVSTKSIATKEAEGIWSLLSRISCYYEPERFLNALSPAQRAAIPSQEFVRSLSSLTIDEKTTCIAQWRDVIASYVEANVNEQHILEARKEISGKQFALDSSPESKRLASSV